MIQFFTSLYSKAIINKLPPVKFPLTHAMCDKNAYETFAELGSQVLMQFQVRYGKLMSVVLFKMEDKESIKVYSFEVTSDCHLMDYGTYAMNELKREFSKISLNSLVESKVFYEKQGFEQTGETQYTWRKEYAGTIPANT
jgi:hypothetical protein